MKSKTWLWIVLIIVFILVAGGAIYYFKFYKKTAAPEATASPSLSQSATPTSVETVTDAGVTWLKPQVLGDLSLIKTGDTSTGIAEVKYYKIAELEGGGELILANLVFDGPGLPVLYYFKKDTQGKYAYIVKVSSEKDLGVVRLALKEGVTIDETTTYKSLTPADTLTIKNTTFKSSNSVGWFSDLKDPVEVGQTAYGKMYRTVNSSSTTEVGGVVFFLKLIDSTYRNYSIKADFLTDDEVAQITWSDGTKNLAKYTSEGYVGCAMTASNNVILKTENISSRLKEAGQTSSGDKIYTVAQDDPVMLAAYENYKLGREKDVLSLADFAAKKPVFIWKDGLGNYIIFTGRDFAGLAECGKPVIYLYPTVPTKISVKVEALITKSEPLYNNGWEVLAYPDGKLDLAGKIYDYLFWEGTGQEYPIVNAGTVVKKEDIQGLLEKQLGELGLNDKEKADFLEFWLPKMPDKPYVRLTWLGNNEMNRLAPLSVSPAPETLIRIFLDFEGLNTPINITPQRLSSPDRYGFTLVEWGGLLRK